MLFCDLYEFLAKANKLLSLDKSELESPDKESSECMTRLKSLLSKKNRYFSFNGELFIETVP